MPVLLVPLHKGITGGLKLPDDEKTEMLMNATPLNGMVCMNPFAAMLGFQQAMFLLWARQVAASFKQ